MTASLPAAMPSTTNPLLIAVVLPQFHPTPENDEWWGRGFTEWTNVAQATAQFPGHTQPQLPADLGFYDLRLPEARAAQADLAKAYGIGGFCYYHYWFHGKRMLNRPVDEILQSGQPDFPFCLCWANEGWNRAWDGNERQVLIEQRYSEADDEAHFEALLPFFSDPRHIRIGGKPLFVVYRASNLPQPARTFERWRQRAIQVGLGELCLAQFEPRGAGTAVDPRSIGLDYSIEFTPDWRSMGEKQHRSKLARLAARLGLMHRGYSKHGIFEYGDMVKQTLAKPDPDYPYLRCVCPGFDNSPRRPNGNALILRNNDPALYEDWLRQILAWTRQRRGPGEQIVFINAWNEWAEGNHLEPDNIHGRAFLEATQRALVAASDG